MKNTLTRAGLIKVASGLIEADLIIKNANVLNVFTNEIIHGNVAVYQGYIAGIGAYDAAKKIIDAQGRYLVPGFINAHCHVESSMVVPEIYCAEELRWGVTTLITDPHEIANVAGIDGIRFMLDASANIPINYFVQLPSCVPATSYEHSGAELSAADLEKLLAEPRVLGLGEMMDYPGVLKCDPHILDKLEIAKDCVIDGHSPGLTGYPLSGYVAAGIQTDHESISFPEALEKLRTGVAILIREGSHCKNLEDIVKGIVANNLNPGHIAFCTDDKHLADIRREGTIRYCVKKAISLGMDPIQAYSVASINAARIYRLRDIGAIAPGYRADMVLLDDFENVVIAKVFKDGKIIDDIAFPNWRDSVKWEMKNSVNLPLLTALSFGLPEAEEDGYPVVGIVEGQIVTRKSYIPKEDVQEKLNNGDLCKIAVVERHHATGHIGVGLVAGYGLRNGAIASTVAHDSHNLIVVGNNDKDMLLAAQEVKLIHGGFALAGGGKIIASLPLPIYGLMSNKEPEELIQALENMNISLRKAGIGEGIDMLIMLSFLALPVIPEIRVTDMGIFDVTQSRFLCQPTVGKE